MCVDIFNPAAAPTATELFDFALVRQCPRPGIDQRDALRTYSDEWKLARLDLALCLDSDAFPPLTPGNIHTERRKYIYDLLVDYHPKYLIVGNEPDAIYFPEGESPASWRMTPSDYLTLWRDAARAISQYHNEFLGERTIQVVGGQISGSTRWLHEFFDLLATDPKYTDEVVQNIRVDIHAYVKHYKDFMDLIKRYEDDFGHHPWCCFEWNMTPGVFHLNQYAAIMSAMNLMGVEVATYFSWSNTQALLSNGESAQLGYIDYPEIVAEVGYAAGALNHGMTVSVDNPTNSTSESIPTQGEIEMADAPVLLNFQDLTLIAEEDQGKYLGGDWGGVMTGQQFMERSKFSLRNTGIYIEVTRMDGATGVYKIADISGDASLKELATLLAPFLGEAASLDS